MSYREKYLGVLAAVSSFISDVRVNDGGYTKIIDDDINELSHIIQLLIELKCEPDPDNNYSIEFVLINRLKERQLWPPKVPYRDESKQYGDNHLIQLLSSAVLRASEALRNELDIIDHNIREKEKNDN